MASKLDLNVQQLATMKRLNMALKYHGLICAISGGDIFIKSHLDFIEKVGVLHDREALSCYDNIMFDTLELNKFLSKYLKTSTEITETEKCIELFNSKHEMSCILHRIIPVYSGTTPYTEQVEQFYAVNYHREDVTYLFDIKHTLAYASIGEPNINALRQKLVVELEILPEKWIFFSKSLFGDLRNTVDIEVGYGGVVKGTDDRKHYIMFRQIEEVCDIYTLVAFIL